jgi:DNA polymerase-1
MIAGRVYPEFNQVVNDDYGTVTGRLSSSNPNAQQVPKRNKELGKIFRKIWIPDDGTYWSANDYKGQELVVFAHYSGAPMLVEGYHQEPPLDMHSVVAAMLSVERDPTAKRLNLGKLYGMGVPKLAKSLKIDMDRARELSNQYDMMLPEARMFMKKAEARAKSRGFVFTAMGRRRRFPDSRFAHKAGNSIIQGTSADITKLKMVEVDEYFESIGDTARVALQVHDDLCFFIPHGAEEVEKEAQRIMQSFTAMDLIHLKVPLRVDSHTGPNWSVATYGA